MEGDERAAETLAAVPVDTASVTYLVLVVCLSIRCKRFFVFVFKIYISQCQSYREKWSDKHLFIY